jgi:hypothetical protein
MVLKNRNIQSTEARTELPAEFRSQAGLIVKTADDVWGLSPLGKGNKINISWLQNFNLNSELRYILLDTLIHYSETQTSSTVATVCFSLVQGFPKDNESDDEFERIWNGLGSSSKKTLKGFLGTCLKLNHVKLKKHHVIASKFKHKKNFQALHPTKGRLTDFEYDSVLQNLRSLCSEIPETAPNNIGFYQTTNFNSKTFVNFRNIMSYRLMIQLARRPKQISILKWCDVLPVGVSFSDKNVSVEPIYTGVKSLHVRSYKIKQSKQENGFRLYPEKWTIPLSESFSALLIRYRILYFHGFKLALNNSKLEFSEEQLQDLFNYCPIFPNLSLFIDDLNNYNITKTINEKSQLFHLSEDKIRGAGLYYGKGLSERHGKITASNNRLRHTWLCNAALEGNSLQDISKITNVTLPGAREYLQLGLKERQFINENYAANGLLREAFNPKPFASDNDSLIEHELIGPLGVEEEFTKCNVCEHKIRMARPIACYGCTNFRPLLDADHESILKQAITKRDFNKKFGTNVEGTGSIKRLDKAIAYIKLTIVICNETKLQKRSLR